MQLGDARKLDQRTQEALRQRAVLLVENGATHMEAALAVGVHRGTISRWCGAFRRNGAAGAQRSRDAADILLGYRPVKVNQSYINALHAALQNAREVAGHNYELGTHWKNEAHRLEILLADQEAVIKQTDGNLASCKDTLQQERNRYEKKNDTLHSILFVTSALTNAEKAGRGGSPEHQELNLLKDEMLAIVSQHGNFDRFPEEKHARYIFLIKTLDP